MGDAKNNEAVQTPTTPEEEIAALLQQGQADVDKARELVVKQSQSANANVDALLALSRSARKVRQSSPGFAAVRPPLPSVTSDLTQKLEALKVK